MDVTLKKTSGFTIFELIMVIAIISIVSAFAFSSWQGEIINLEGQAQQIMSDLRYTQALAMTQGQRYRWVRVSSTTYQVLNASGTAVPLTQGNTTATLSSGTTFSAFTNLPSNLIAFDGTGIPYTDTAIPGTALASAATIPITQSGLTKTISISPGTGRMIIQ